jgi:hypothetical protein
MNMERVQAEVLARYEDNNSLLMGTFGPYGIETDAVDFLQVWYDAQPTPKPNMENVIHRVYRAWEDYSCECGEPIPMLTAEILRDDFVAPDSIASDSSNSLNWVRMNGRMVRTTQ